MNQTMTMFLPNRNPTAKVYWMMIGVWVVFLGLLWSFSGIAYVPTPSETFTAFQDLVNNGLARELANSLLLNFEAILVSLVISLGLAYATTVAALRPVVTFIGSLRFLSMVGLSYFIARATTGGHEQKLSLLVFSITTFFVTSMADVVASVPKENYDLAHTLGMGEWRSVWEVVVLGTAAQAFDALRGNAAMGWMLLSMVESTVRAEGGVGAVLSDQQHHFDISAVLALMIVTLAYGLVQDRIIVWLKRQACPYANLKFVRK